MTPPHDDAAHSAHAAASTPALLNEAYVAAFNARDLDALEVLYEPPAVLVPVPGSSVTGPARAAASTHLVGMGVSEARIRQSYQVDDLALLLVDWSARGHEGGLEGIPPSVPATLTARRVPSSCSSEPASSR
jgi:ketosteroid isomerase-like protein